MLRIRTIALVLIAAFLVACTAAQMEAVKKATAAAPRIIAKIAAAYGSPYAIAIQAFADAVAPMTISAEPTPEVKDEATVAGEDDISRLQLSAQVDVVREAVVDQRQIAVPVRDGDVLTENDNYKLQVSCNIDCYAYIAQLDSTGKMDPILPSNFVAINNPLKADITYSLPAGNEWFFLDSNTGVEQVYFILSKYPRADIEKIFGEISAANESLTRVTEVSIDEPMLLERGIGGIRQGRTETVQFQNGKQGQYLSTLLESIEGELVVTRWFNHE